MKDLDHTKYRWFVTSGRKLVIGGKSAEQNEQLIRSLIEPKNNLEFDSQTALKNYSKDEKYVVMHTRSPGSPFAIILSKNPTKKDLDEACIFTGAFSRAWKQGKHKTRVDVFLLEQMYKQKKMKTGTFGVTEKIDHKIIEPKLYLVKQKGVLRAVPFERKNSICIAPGKMSKAKFAEQISVKLDIPEEEVLNALPTGGFKTCN